MDYIGNLITKNPPAPSPTAAPGMWTLSEAMQYQKAGIWPPGYQISRSVRLRSSASAYFNRTPASAGNRTTWTWSGWVKRGNFSSSSSIGILEGNAGATDLTAFRFTNDSLGVQDYSNSGSYNLVWTTTAVFRDPSAWYHVVLAYDTTQASSANAVKIYVNGVQQTSTFTANTGA